LGGIHFAVSGSMLAHGLHYSVLGIGLLGVIVLLAPRLGPAARCPSAQADEHECRVLAVRVEEADG